MKNELEKNSEKASCLRRFPRRKCGMAPLQVVMIIAITAIIVTGIFTIMRQATRMSNSGVTTLMTTPNDVESEVGITSTQTQSTPENSNSSNTDDSISNEWD